MTNNNQLVLVESKTMRDEMVYRDVVMDKVKTVSTITPNLEVTLEMASNYYEVPIETVRTIIKRNREEFNEYGELKLLKGKALSEFKAMVQDELSFKGINSLQLLSRRGLLRLGMMLTESEVATSIRNYLLNVEESSTEEQKRWAVEREISKRERRMLTEAIKDFFIGDMKGYEYSTFTNLVYNILFDCNTKQLKEMYQLDKNENLRDNFTTDDLKRVVSIERVIASLLRLGKDYNEVKEELLKVKHTF